MRGADVFIVQPTCGNAATGLTANDALMELLVMIDAAVGGSAHRVIAVTPWYGYSRQDKKSAPREPISARLVARMLEAAGIDRILTMDLHSGQIQGFFQKPCDHMTALFMLTQYFADLGLEDLVVVAPDAGRVKLNKQFAAKIGADLAILNKERPAQQVAEISYVIGDVAGKTALLVDDIIDTAGTLKAAAQAVRDAGARRIYAAATHGIFSGNAWENLAAAGFEQIVVTDTIPLPPGAPGQRPRALLRRPADQLDPPDLHRRLGAATCSAARTSCSEWLRSAPGRAWRPRAQAVTHVAWATRVPWARPERTGRPADGPARPQRGRAVPRCSDVDALTLLSGQLDHRAELRDPARPARRGPGAAPARRCCAAGCGRRGRAGGRSTR